MPRAITSFLFTDHARGEMRRRGIGEVEVRRLLADPGQRIPVRPGREVVQAHTNRGGHAYLLRVIVDVDRHPAEVVTAYRTSRIDKYWRKEQ